MQFKEFKDIENLELEQIKGGDWLKDVRDYVDGLVSGIKSIFK